MSYIDDIKNFCRKLSTHNISRVTAQYDGSGDSGDFENITAIVHPTQAELDSAAAIVRDNPGVQPARERTVDLGRWLDANVYDKDDANITLKEYEEFVDNLFGMLPGGWEINDGSYGDIVVDVATGKIEHEHNERYTDVRTDNFTY
jgi:hypothetical protein